MKKNLLIRAIDVLYVLFVCAIAVISLVSMASGALPALLLLPFLLAVIIWALRSRPRGAGRLPYRTMWLCLFAVGAVLMFAFALSVCPDNLSWDWGKLIRSAAGYVLTEGEVDLIYFARYPNNQFWYGVLVCLFSLVHMAVPSVGFPQLFHLTIVMGCLMVLVSIGLFHHIAVMLWGEKKAFFAGVFLWLCFPLWMWSPYAYTDTSGMMLLMILLYVWLVLRRKGAKGAGPLCLLALFGLLAGVAWKLKVTVFIFVLAVFLTMLLEARRTALKGLVAGLLIAVLCAFGSRTALGAGLYRLLPIDAEDYDKNEFPMSHWVMMSLKYGGYDQEDVDFTGSFPSYEEKQRANLSEIKRRLRARSAAGNLKFFLVNKQFRTWSDPSFAGCEYLSRAKHDPDGRLEELVRQDGDKNGIFLVVLSLYYGVMVAGMVAGALAALRNTERGGALSAARLTMLGIALLMTLWECNSRYIVLFLPLMALLSSEGYVELRKGLVKKKHGEEDTT